MPIQRPQSKSLPPVQPKGRRVPVEQIIQTLGQNPLARGIEEAGSVLAQALERRAQLKKEQQQLAAVQEALPGEKIPAGIRDPQLAMSLLERKAALAKANKPEPTYVPFVQTASGELQPQTPLAPGQKPGPVGRPGHQSSLAAQERVGLQRENLKLGVVNRFNADPAVRKAQNSIDAAGNVRDLATSGNPIAASAIPTYMARASGEVGALSEGDKAPFGGSRAILARFQAALTQMSTGQLTPENQQFLLQLSGLMEKSANRNLDNLARLRAKQYSKTSNLFQEEELYQSLRPTMEAPGTPVERKATHRWNPATGKVEAIP